MATAVSHENESDTSHEVFLDNLLTLLESMPDKYTIVAQNDVGLAGGWFVVSMVGFNWQLWIGTIGADGSLWHADNKSSAFLAQALNVAFSPCGGWAETDDPSVSGSMFSDAPVAGHWLKIRMGWTTAAATSWFTVIDDNDTGMFIVLVDSYRNNTWDFGVAVMPFESRLPEISDPYPWVLFAGVPKMLNSSSCWLNSSGASGSSAMVLPGGSVEGPLYGVEGNISFTSSNQPNSVTGSYDTERVELRSNGVGFNMLRGKVSSTCLRYVYDGLTNRLELADGTWIVPSTNAGIILPWVP